MTATYRPRFTTPTRPRLLRLPTLGLGILLLFFLSPGMGTPPPIAEPSLPSLCATGTEPHRIAIASLGDGAYFEISSLAGRAPFFLVLDTRSGLTEVVANDFFNQEKGAGVGAAYLLSEIGADCLVAGDIGTKMLDVLEAEEIAFASSAGPAQKAIDTLLGASEALP